MHFTLAAVEIAKEHINILSELAIEHVNHRDHPSYSRAEIPGTGMAFTIFDRHALADDGIKHCATFVDAVDSVTEAVASVGDDGTTFPPLRLV